mmetsp:Transcript_44507/g.123195  ORF Transcript_44507/g.123195 Transcript_44507/m.123195 type:complete len:317 (-) Transcript_44507:343-1293(-)
MSRAKKAPRGPALSGRLLPSFTLGGGPSCSALNWYKSIAVQPQTSWATTALMSSLNSCARTCSCFSDVPWHAAPWLGVQPSPDSACVAADPRSSSVRGYRTLVPNAISTSSSCDMGCSCGKLSPPTVSRTSPGATPTAAAAVFGPTLTTRITCMFASLVDSTTSKRNSNPSFWSRSKSSSASYVTTFSANVFGFLYSLRTCATNHGLFDISAWCNGPNPKLSVSERRYGKCVTSARTSRKSPLRQCTHNCLSLVSSFDSFGLRTRPFTSAYSQRAALPQMGYSSTLRGRVRGHAEGAADDAEFGREQRRLPIDPAL